MVGVCIICGEKSKKLVKCKDLKYWQTLFDYAVKNKKDCIILCSSRKVFPISNVALMIADNIDNLENTYSGFGAM